MTIKRSKLTLTKYLLAGSAVNAIAIAGAGAQSISDEIVVTSQRTEQSLQDVPIAVSAFGGEELNDRQIETLQDVQFNIPSFSFSRTGFTGSAVSLRGIASFATGATTEPSVSVHLNDVFQSATRLFETEFFDIERLEVLRGPQGTLFGRNATAGVINVITNKADPTEIGGHVDVEYGNFNSVKFKGALNVPIIEDVLAARVAGTIIQRDGFAENTFTGNDIDDRDIVAVRGSVRWFPTENTTVDVTASHFRENDARQRATATLCNPDPVSGCVPGPLGFGGLGPDQNATTLGLSSVQAFTFQGVGTGSGILDDAGISATDPRRDLVTAFATSQAANFGLLNLADGPNFSPFPQSTDPRVQSFDVDPSNRAEETVVVLNVKHDTDNLSFKFNAGYGESLILQEEDFDGVVSPEFFLSPTFASGVPAGAFPIGVDGGGAPIFNLAVGGLPILANTLFAGGTLPVSGFGQADTNTLQGAQGGNEIARSNRQQAISQSFGLTEYYNFEGIVSSDFDSRYNFLLGASFSRSVGEADFAVSATSLDFFGAVGGTLVARNGTFAGALAAGQTPADALAAANAIDGVTAFVPFFLQDSEDVTTRSISIFGEAYIDITDTLKLTGGIRQNFDRKSSNERGSFLESLLDDDSTTPVIPVGTGPETIATLLESFNPFLFREADFNATTGRAILQWTPSDNSEVYASYSRGFKAGGFNPVASASFPGIDPIFGAENINAFEIGVKSNLLDGLLRANLTGYYYDYSGLQVSNFQQQTAVNENIDARVFGVEGEFVIKPTDDLVFNSTISYLNTQITDEDFLSINTLNPTADNPNAIAFKDLTNASNCTLEQDPTELASLGLTTLLGADLSTINPAFAAGNPLLASPFTVCSALEDFIEGAFNPAVGTSFEVTPLGIAQSVDGNDLPSSPEFTISAGAQYTFRLANGLTITPRADAYYQTSSFSTIFNEVQDDLPDYVIANAQVTIAPDEGNWFVRGFVQNLTDNDVILGLSALGGQTSGNFSQGFLSEPRRYGVGVGFNF